MVSADSGLSRKAIEDLAINYLLDMADPEWVPDNPGLGICGNVHAFLWTYGLSGGRVFMEWFDHRCDAYLVGVRSWPGFSGSDHFPICDLAESVKNHKKWEGIPGDKRRSLAAHLARYFIFHRGDSLADWELVE